MSMVKIRAALETQLQTIAPILPDAALASVGTGPNSVFTTTTPHGLVNGLLVRLPGYTGGTPALQGLYYVVVTGTNTFYLQNSATKSGIAVIIPGSGGVVSAYLTAEENVLFQIVQGVPYQMLNIVPFKPNEPTQGPGFYQDHGLFQVTLVYPVGVGLTAILARAELIRQGFKKGSTFLNNGVTVTIMDTPEFGRLGTTDNLMLPVKIGYSANIFN